MFLPSNTASFISLTLGMARSSFPEIDFEVAESVHLERAPGMHHDGGVGGLDHRRALDAVARDEQGPVVYRGRRRLLQIGPVDAAFAAAGFRIDPGSELLRHGK